VSVRWVTLQVGSPGAITVAQAELEAHGIPTFVPWMHTKLADPTITGGGHVFDWELQVPESRVAEARELRRARAEAGREALERHEFD
jgi:hypothetical protein